MSGTVEASPDRGDDNAPANDISSGPSQNGLGDIVNAGMNALGHVGPGVANLVNDLAGAMPPGTATVTQWDEGGPATVAPSSGLYQPTVVYAYADHEGGGT